MTVTITVCYDGEAPYERPVLVKQNSYVMFRFTIDEAHTFIKDLEEAVRKATC